MKISSPFLLFSPLLAVLATGAVHAASVIPDVSETSGSVPHLDAGPNAWVSFDSNQGAPSKGGLVVVYNSADPADFPLNPIGADVTLRPTETGMPLPCTPTAAEPDLNTMNAGKCFFRVGPSGKRILVYYLGQLEADKNIRLTITGLQPAAGSPNTVQPFDSDTVLAASKPVPAAGRIPARLGLVLDKSGSMEWSSHPFDKGQGNVPCNNFGPPLLGCEPARWEVLQLGVEALLTIADAYLLSGDEVIVAPFDSTAQNASPAPLDHAAVNSIRNQVKNVLKPGGGTSIGAGLVAVEDDVKPVDPNNRNQYVLLFTDGDQNTKPWVVFNDKQVRINETVNDPVFVNGGPPVRDWAADTDAGTSDAQLCPFALRADSPGAPLGTQFNNDIAIRRCKGVALTAVSVDPKEPELIQYFLQIVSSTLIGDKLEVAAVRGGQVTQGKSWAEESFVVSRRDAAFTVLVAWTEPLNGLSQAWLEKDGVVFPFDPAAVSGRLYQGQGLKALTLRAPYCTGGKCVDPEGEWKLGLLPFFKDEKTFTYNVFVTADNALFASRFQAEQPQPGVGEPLVLEANLEEGGKPVEGLPAGSVRVVVKRPKAGLGNVLGPAKVRPLTQPEGDTISPAGLKAAAMLRDPAQRDALLAALLTGDVQVIPLVEEAPGVYRAKYGDTVAEGAYGLEFLVDGKTEGNGRVTRTFTFTRYVPVVPDAASTWATATVKTISCPPSTSGGKYPCGCLEATLKPVDRAGNLLGPGKASMFSVPAKAGQKLAPAVDHLDGSYTVQIAQAVCSTPPAIAIGGVVLPSARARSAG